MNDYNKYVLRVCAKPCWESGPPCTLAPAHPGSCVNVGPFTRPSGTLFDGSVPSSRRGQPAYHVVVTSASSSCTCLGFKYNRDRDCSHIRIIKEALSA